MKDDIEETRRILAEMSKPQAKKEETPPVQVKPALTEEKSKPSTDGPGGNKPPNEPKGGGSEGGDGSAKWTWNNFVHGLTIKGFIGILVVVILALSAFNLTRDSEANIIRAKNEKEYLKGEIEKELAKQKTKQAEIHASTMVNQRKSLPGNASSNGNISTNVERCLYSSINDSFVVPAGKCIVFDNTSGGLQSDKYFVSSGTTTEIVSVEGGDFTVVTADKDRLSCNSQQVSDRCANWVAQNQKKGDKGLYWYMFKVPHGHKITINTSKGV